MLFLIIKVKEYKMNANKVNIQMIDIIIMSWCFSSKYSSNLYLLLTPRSLLYLFAHSQYNDKYVITAISQ